MFFNAPRTIPATVPGIKLFIKYFLSKPNIENTTKDMARAQ